MKVAVIKLNYIVNQATQISYYQKKNQQNTYLHYETKVDSSFRQFISCYGQVERGRPWSPASAVVQLYSLNELGCAALAVAGGRGPNQS